MNAVGAANIDVSGNVYNKKYIREVGKPDTIIDALNFEAGSYTLIVYSGDEGGKDRVTSARISIGGKDVYSPSDFKKDTYILTKDVSIVNGSTITVTLNGSPGSYLSVYIIPAAGGAVRITIIVILPLKTTQKRMIQRDQKLRRRRLI